MKITPVLPEAMPALHNSDDSSVIVSAPAFSHTLRFQEPQLEASFQEFLREKAHSNLSQFPATKERFVLFAAMFLTTLFVTGFSYLSDKESYDLADGGLVIQFVGLLVLFTAGLSTLALAYKHRHKSRPLTRLLAALFLLTSSLYTVLDSSLVYLVMGDSELKPALVGLIPLFLTMLAMQYLFACEFFFFGLISLFATSVYLGVHLAAKDRGVSQTVLEFVVLLVCTTFLTRRLYTLEKAVRLTFLIEKLENRAQKSSKSSNSVPANSSVSHNTELEDILNRISNVHAILTDACALITYQDLRARMKSALKDLDLASSKLAVQAPSIFTQRVDRISHDIDEDDRLFVQQNFMMTKASDFASQAAPAVQHEVVSFNINLEYGLSELLAVMNQLGKNWNFDMFFVHEITHGKPISVTGRYCLSKFDLSTKFNIADITAQKFFAALEGQYKNNPYHNNTHGADVLNSTFFLYNHSFIIGHMTDVEILGAVIATLGHDIPREQ